MRFKSLIFFCMFLPLSLSLAYAQGYSIKVKVNGLGADTCFIGNYYGQHQYIKDTAISNAKGEMTFTGKEALPGGIYFVVLPKKKFFEIIVNKEQNMNFETDTSNFMTFMKVKGSKENMLFYEYLNYATPKQKIYEKYKAKKAAFKDGSDSSAFYQKKLEKIDEELKDYKTKFMNANPDFLISKVFLASKDPEVPEAPILPNGRKDSLFTYRYYKQHYWDNIDFNDDRLLRTPVFYNKLNFYLNNMIAQTPDSIIKEADMLIEKSRGNKEVFKYLVWYLTYTYETSYIMGFDAIFVHMVETYYMTNQAYWLTPTQLENLTKRAKKLGPILLGKVAPNLIMQDTNLNLQSLHSVNAKYTMLLFWDPECGHCQKEVPEIHQMYIDRKAELNLEVFCVCTDTNMAKMKAFIRKHNLTEWINVNGPRALTKNFAEMYDVYSTPVILILDDKKVIIAKKLPVDKIEDFIRNHMEMKALEKK